MTFFKTMNDPIAIDTIVRSRRKTLAIEVARDASLVVRAPRHVSRDFIERFVQSHAPWIRQRQEAQRQRLRAQASFTLADGRMLLLFGRAYPLSVVEQAAEPCAFSGAFILRADEPTRAQAAIGNWYKRTAYASIKERIEYFSRSHGFAPGGFVLSSARSRWGSCSPANVIRVNWRLVMAPPEIIDYVVVHELAHTKEKNHSAAFWAHVLGICPDYRSRRAWLRNNEHILYYPL